MEKSLEQSESPEFESKTIGPMTVIYRDNSLFQKYIPVIKSHIESLGGEIRFVSFPRGTDKRTIEEWYQESQDTLTERVLLSDYTCGNVAMNLNIKGLPGSQLNGLDMILERASLVSLKDELGDKFFAGREINSFNGYDQVFPKIFRMLLSKETNRPRKIHIISKAIFDHMRQCADRPDDIEEAFESGYEMVEKIIAERFKKYIETAGFSSENIAIQGYISEEIDKEDNWILVDRHYTQYHGAVEDMIKNATPLVLPISDLVSGVVKHGLLDLPEKKIEEILIASLDSNFKKKG